MTSTSTSASSGQGLLSKLLFQCSSSHSSSSSTSSSSTNTQTADIITTHTADLEGDMEFFASLETNTDLAFFRREELQTHLLSQGSFSTTQAVVGTNGACSGSFRRRQVEETMWGEDYTIPQHYQTEAPALQPRYVIKQLCAESLRDSDQKTLSRAARELVNDAKYLARLAGHANIVRLRGLTKDAFGHNYVRQQFEDFFLLRDRVLPQTLHDRIYHEWRSGYEPDEDLILIKANYAFQIAKALRYCHQQGVLYRDLQPKNIGFKPDDPHCVQLMEFGLARDLPKADSQEDAPFRMTLAGTRRYLAGEVLTSGSYTRKSDVYSFGMVYYEMCTEEKPYQGLSAGEHQTYVCQHGDRPCLADFYLPEALEVILTQSWHPHLQQRWSMDEVCAALQTFLMQLDGGYYQQQEGDFLFDVEPTPIYVESWTEEYGEQGDAESIGDAYSVMDTSNKSFYVEEEVAPPVYHYCHPYDSCSEDEEEPNKHSDRLHRRGSMSSRQSDRPHRRGSMSSRHSDVQRRRGSMSSRHSDVPRRRGSMSSRHSDVPHRRGSLSSKHSDLPHRRGSLSSVQAVTPLKIVSEAA